MRRFTAARLRERRSARQHLQHAAYSTTQSLLALEKVSTQGNTFTMMTITGATVRQDEDNGIKGESGISIMRCLKPTNAEAFYFGDEGKTFCRLCQEDTTLAPRVHIAASSRQSHTNHTCREVVLDSLTLWNRRGYSVDNIIQCYSHALFHHKEFIRINALTDWRLPVAERARRLTELLAKLRDMGYIDLSLAIAAADNLDSNYQNRRRLAFERLECIGDNSWGNNMSNRMMLLFPDRQWIHSQSAYSFNCFRDALEMNLNLEAMYEFFDLGALLSPAVREKVGTGKVKADVLESLLGELQIWMWGFEPELHDSMPYVEVNGLAEGTIYGLLQHALTEFYDVMALAYCQELAGTAIPLSKELAARHLWSVEAQPVYKSKDRSGLTRKVRAFNSRRIVLPPYETLSPSPASADSPDPAVSAAWARKDQPNPARGALVPETVDRFTNSDVFEELMPSMEATEVKLNAAVRSVPAGRHLRKAWRTCIGGLKLQIANAGSSDDGDDDALDDDASLLAAAADEDDVYFRDRYYDLSEAPQSASSSPSTESRTSTVGSAGEVDNMLFVSPVLSHEREGLQQLQGLVIGGTVCLFEPSSLVPADVKPPNAGVITDKNLFFGVFLNSKIEVNTATVQEEYF